MPVILNDIFGLTKGGFSKEVLDFWNFMIYEELGDIFKVTLSLHTCAPKNAFNSYFIHLYSFIISSYMCVSLVQFFTHWIIGLTKLWIYIIIFCRGETLWVWEEPAISKIQKIIFKRKKEMYFWHLWHNIDQNYNKCNPVYGHQPI